MTTDLKTAAQFLEQALTLVTGDRAVSHGDKSINFKNIAVLWTAYLQIAKPYRNELSPLDVGNMMELLKIARRVAGNYNEDDYVDGAGYAACAGEIAANRGKEKQCQ